jgi:hypothetical protein
MDRANLESLGAGKGTMDTAQWRRNSRLKVAALVYDLAEFELSKESAAPPAAAPAPAPAEPPAPALSPDQEEAARTAARRKAVSILLPALLGGAYGGLAGAGVGAQQPPGGGPIQLSGKGALAGAGIGAGVGGGAGLLKVLLSKYLGTDPLTGGLTHTKQASRLELAYLSPDSGEEVKQSLALAAKLGPWALKGLGGLGRLAGRFGGQAGAGGKGLASWFARQGQGAQRLMGNKFLAGDELSQGYRAALAHGQGGNLITPGLRGAELAAARTGSKLPGAVRTKKGLGQAHGVGQSWANTPMPNPAAAGAGAAAQTAAGAAGAAGKGWNIPGKAWGATKGLGRMLPGLGLYGAFDLATGANEQMDGANKAMEQMYTQYNEMPWYQRMGMALSPSSMLDQMPANVRAAIEAQNNQV